MLTIGEHGSLIVGGTSGQVYLGFAAGSSGHIMVDGGFLQGVNISATTSGLNSGFLVGRQGSGTLTLRNGGTLRVGTGNGKVQLAFADNSSGTIIIGAAEGQGPVAAGTLEAGSIWFGETTGFQGVYSGGEGRVLFNHNSADYTFGVSFGASVSGRGVVDFLAGRTTLTSSSTAFGGVANVATGATMAFGGGDRTFGNGDVTVNLTGGTLGTAHGLRAPMTLTIAGDLLMTADSTLDMGLGAISETPEDPDSVGTGDLIIVEGTLRLDGTISIFDIGGEGGGPGFGIGRYELINYGSLHGDSADPSGIDLDLAGGLNGSLTVDAPNSRIILTIDAGLGSLAYWGLTDGDWNSAGWSATENMAPPLNDWTDGTGAIFRGPDGGNVTIGSGGVVVSTLSIETEGYVIDGGPLRFAPAEEDGPAQVTFGVMNSVSGHLAAAVVEDVAGLRLIKDGNGTLVLSSDDNHWTGGTTVNNGRLVIGDGGSSGTLPGDVALFGTLAFNRSDTTTYAGAITNTGALRQIGSGTLVLTNANSSRSGQTFIENGRLELHGDGGLGSGAVNISSGATLGLYRTGDWSFTNTLNGNGTLEQRGGGVLTLSGNLGGFSGSLAAISGRINLGAGSNFGGSVTVNDALVVNGTVGGAVSVSSGGTVSGTGSIGSLSVGNGGTVAPGNSIGTLTVTSTASFAPGSTYEVEADNNGAADRINVSGALNITGGMVQVKASPDVSASWSPATAYTILQHGVNSRQGEFEGVETDLAFLDPSLEYGTGVVRLHLERNNIAFADVALTANQRQAAAALEALGYGHDAAGPVVPLHDAVVAGTSLDARAAFDAVSGELHASLAGMMLDDSRLVRDALLGRAAMYAGRGGATSVWARAMSHSGDAEGDGVSDFERNVNGLLVGADHSLGDAYGYGWTAGHHRSGDADISDLRSAGEVKSTHIGAYLGARAEGLGLRAGASYSWHEVDTRRTIDFAGFKEYLVADYKARGVQLFAEADYEIEVAGQLIAPFVNLAWASVDVEGWDEAEFHFPVGSTASLRAQSQKHDATFATLGARSDLALGDRFELQGMLGYRRTLSGDEPTLRVGFSDGNQAFTVQGVPLARDAFVADIGLALRIGQNMRIGAAYNGLIGSDARDHSVEARISIALQ